MTVQQTRIGRRPATRCGQRVGLVQLVTVLMSLSFLLASVWAQDDTSRKRGVPVTGTRESRLIDSEQDAGLPREIGKILEVSEEALQSGNNSVRYIRNVANAIYDWLLHLRISVVENDAQSIRYDIQNCQLLYELIEQSNPSTILMHDILDLRSSLPDNGDVEFTSTLLQLQLDIQKFGYLYPLSDLTGQTGRIMRHHREGDIQLRDAAIGMLERNIVLPNLDQPIEQSLASFDAALDMLDEGQDEKARKQVKEAASLISLLNVGTFLCEGQWYIGKADDALKSRLYSITLASLKKVDSKLEDAEDRAWSGFSEQIGVVRQDVERLIAIGSDRKGKTSLTSAKILAIAKRIDAELLMMN